jgi:signal transduction histidine kinase
MAGTAAQSPASRDDAEAQRLAVAAIEVRDGARMSIGGMVIMLGVLFFVRWEFAGVTWSPPLFNAWLLWMFGVVGLYTAAIAIFFGTRPDDYTTVHFWPRPGQWVQIGLNLGIAACPWVLLPGTSPALQYVTMLLYVWYVSTIIMTGNSGVHMGAWEVALLTASNAIFALWSGVPYRGLVAALVTLIGITLLGFRRLIRAATIKATQAQVASERAVAATRAALALATAERDAKTRFIASATHDLQQPLQAASLFFDAALAMPAGAARDRAIAGAQASFGATQALLEAMLDHLRLEAGAVRARPTPISIGAALAAAALEHEAAAHIAGVSICAMPTRLHVLADNDLLRRALGNLVTNAIRHAAARRILLAARHRGGAGAGMWAEIWIIDNGRGIEEADAGRLFEDYAQGDGAAVGGFGLGLASTRRQMALMGGEVALDRRWRHGAAFVLRLPLATAPPAALETTPAAALAAE